MKLRNVAMLLGTALLWGCSSESIIENPKSDKESLQFTAQVGESFIPSRAIGTAWTAGDKIGVYAVKAGETITKENYDEDVYNLSYTTEKGDGNFTRVLFPIRLDGENAVDIVAYYPYTVSIYKEPVYQVDVADQSNPEAIDLLYSNNVKNIKDNGTENLVFSHKMSQFFFRIQKGEGVETLEGLSVKSISGLVSEGSMDLSNGNMSLGDKKNDIINLPINDENDIKVISAILVPGQSLSSAKLVISLDGKNYTWDGFDKILESGKKYTFKAKLSKNKKGDVVLVMNGAIIEGWINGHEDDDVTNLDPDEPTETEGKIEVNLTSIDFTADASKGEKLAITADDNVEWNLSTESDWISFEPSQGKGNAEIIINVLANETAQQRTGLINVVALDKSLDVTVTQAAKKQETGVTLLYEDGFDLEPKSMELSTYNDLIKDKLTLMPNFFYSKEGNSKIDVRKANGGCIWLPMAGEGSVVFNNISSKDADKLVLTLSMCAESANIVSIEDIKASLENEALEILPNKLLSNNYEDYTITIGKALLSAEEVTMKLFKGNTTKGVRIGNVKIESYK